MDWLATLRRSGGLHALSRQLGAAPADVMAAADRLLPLVLDAMRAFVASRGGGEEGAKALMAVLTGLGDGNLAAEVMGPVPFQKEHGEQLLAQLLPHGAAGAGREGGEECPLGPHLLPGLAMLVAGYLSARAAGSGAERDGSAARIAEMLEPDETDEGDAASSSWDQAV